MELTGQERKELREVIIATYPKPEDLRMVISEGMDIHFNHIFTDSAYSVQVFELIIQFKAEGKLEEFVAVIVRDRPNSPAFKKSQVLIQKIQSVKVTKDMPFKSLALEKIYKEEGSNNHKNNPDTIELNTIRDNQLYEALKLLNFRSQCREISDRIPSQTIGSFLICGEKKSGAEILLDKLYDQKTYFKIHIQLGESQGFNITTFWQKIAETLNLKKESSLEVILSEIVEIQKEQSILFVLTSIDKILPQDISDILIEFWEKLIGQIPQIDTDNKNINNLFLFLVDYQNKYKNEKFCLPFDSRLFTENFTQNDISDWILSVRNLWGHELCDNQNLDCGKAARIFQDSEGGLPHRVYETIYGYFPLAWQSSIMINKLGL